VNPRGLPPSDGVRPSLLAKVEYLTGTDDIFCVRRYIKVLRDGRSLADSLVASPRGALATGKITPTHLTHFTPWSSTCGLDPTVLLQVRVAHARDRSAEHAVNFTFELSPRTAMIFSDANRSDALRLIRVKARCGRK
jgi:hypothetical protein